MLSEFRRLVWLRDSAIGQALVMSLVLSRILLPWIKESADESN